MNGERPPAATTVEWLPTTSGLVGGFLGLALAAGIAVLAVLDWTPTAGPAALAWAVLVAALSWCALLRPRVGLTPATRPERAVVRGMVSTVELPLAGLGTPSVRQVLVLPCGGRTYLSASIGRSRRRLVRAVRAGQGELTGAPEGTDAAAIARVRGVDIADMVVDRLVRASADARLWRTVPEPPDTPARRWAWPEIVVLLGSALAAVVLTAL
ncbi:hypothetical protein K8Z61_02050 [Nocardioides sp. TRM66260-LWL]|uniref:hypothetical protein n=1 Tax=Nocardioides sp. TRM66260-LWL TaxID=2874478 RepID=UPI001CC50720|nr:hypothetical protein [Nocardioides sp. TRM66260-LWL]MBZ5733266.1 hypothetical protein [Nocardioides sp. TRM66260-LWL]